MNANTPNVDTTVTVESVTSKDGTRITFDKSGQGPAVILVTGASGVRAHSRDLAARLAPHFTVYNYDRRGRGDSGDTQPFAVQREIEDLEAIIDAAGGTASLYGISSGGALILEAANKLGSKVSKIAIYEVPFILDDSRPPVRADYVEALNTAIAAGDRNRAAELFMKDAMMLPDEWLEGMRNSPMWGELMGVSHTLSYDGEVVIQYMQGKPLPGNPWPNVTAPTLMMTGEITEPFFIHTADVLTDLLPNTTRQVLAGQHHGVDSAVLAPALIAFFG